MSMFGLGVFLIFLWLLFFLYRKIPNKSIFFLFLLVLITSAGFAAYSVYTPHQDDIAEQKAIRERTIAQQEVFSTWYANYQKILEGIDYHWQQQDQIFHGLQDDDIDLETALQEMSKLEENCQLLLEALAKMPPPAVLDENNYVLAMQVHTKTTNYAEAQLRTVTLCKDAIAMDLMPAEDDATKDDQEKKSAPAPLENVNTSLPPPQNDLNHRLRHIVLTESPAGLFTAREISSLRSNLSLTDEKIHTEETGMEDTDK